MNEKPIIRTQRHAYPHNPCPKRPTRSNPNPMKPHIYKPKDLLTSALTFSSKSGLRSRHMRAASTLAGDSSLGSASILMTLMRIFSTLWMGDQRSEACS